MKNSLAALRLRFVELNMQGSDLIRGRRERAARLLGEIFGLCRDPFVSKMRNVVQRASKISRLGQIGVFQQYCPEAGISSPASLARFTPPIENRPVVRITDFQHAVGRNGDAVPVPPEWNLSVGATVRVILGAAAFLACFILLPALVSIFSQPGETPPLIVGQRLLFGAAMAAGGGLVAVGLGILIAMCWWWAPDWKMKARNFRWTN